jgi:hypothetical protein
MSAAFGNEAAFRKLDIGGFMVTLYRLITDAAFIQKIKEEFVFGNFRAQIQDGDGVYDLGLTSDTAAHPVRAALQQVSRLL